MGVAYLDTSALVKLVVAEAESEALTIALAAWPERATSEIAEVELRRSIRRATTDERAHRRAEEVLAGLYLLALGPEVREEAGRLAPTALRTLDAIHLATALALGDDLAAFVAYDERLLGAARERGLAVRHPGRA